MNVTIRIALIGWLACSPLLAGEPVSPSTSLFQAGRAGDLGAVRTLLKNGADVRARDESGETPLMAAALYADAALVELLVKAGADVNATNKAGATALMRAATFEDKARLLVTHGADVKARSALGNTALILAARKSGSVATVKLLLDHGADVNATNAYGATALMAAAAAEDADSVRLLLDRGADINAMPNMNGDGFIWGGGRTALMWAAFHGNEDLLRLLLQRGAKVNAFSLAGGALTQAAWGGHAGAARLLLDAGAQVDQRDLVANYTPLHWAASSERSSPSLVELLLARQADVDAEGGQPVDNFLGATFTPLALARKRGDTPIVRALLRSGAKEAAAPVLARRGEPGRQASVVSSRSIQSDAIQRALPPLQKTAADSASAFLRHASKPNCVSCHQQQIPMAAISLAESRGFAIDRDAARHQLELLNRDLSSFREPDLQTTFHPEPAIFDGYASLDLHLQRQPPSAETDAIVHQLATFQHADGHWSWNLPRPPIQASDIGATALAVHSLKSFGIPGRRRELELRVEKARAWLAKADAESNEERAHQLLGLAWAGERSGTLKRLVRELLREQRSDGGWGQLAGLDSDAYATGQSLYALMEAGRISPRDEALRRGVEFLLRTQLADGTWHVRRRAFPFQPPMESGFPHGADGWISSAATGWAVIALTTALDPSQTPSPQTALASASKPVGPAAGTLTPSEAAGGSDAFANNSSREVEFSRDIRPVLERSCIPCHSGERAKGGFQIADRASLLRGGKRGEPVIVANHSEQSQLLRFVSDQVEDLEMPPLGKREKFPALTKEEVARLRAWIDQGAAWPGDATLRAAGK